MDNNFKRRLMAEQTASYLYHGYSKSGLLFYLDGEYQGDEPGYWVDLIGGHKFKLNNCIVHDNCIEFTGANSFAKCADIIFNSGISGTIEIAFSIDPDMAYKKNFNLFCQCGDGSNDLIGLGYSTTYNFFNRYGPKWGGFTCRFDKYYNYNTISVRATPAYRNFYQNNESFEFSNYYSQSTLINDGTYIGLNPKYNSDTFTGKIYSIRIYSDSTPDNMINNQINDTNRFFPKEYIQFQDPETERICIEKFSSDGIGLTKEDAEAVTTLGGGFAKTNIVKFNELKYFKNVKLFGQKQFESCPLLEEITLPPLMTTLTYWCFRNCPELVTIHGSKQIEAAEDSCCWVCKKLINFDTSNLKQTSLNCFNTTNLERVVISEGLTELANGSFRGCTNLKFVDLPSTVTGIYGYCFSQSNAIQTFICRAVVPPTTTVYGVGNQMQEVYVPDESIEAYKVAEGWSRQAKKFKPLSSYVPK